MLRFMLSLVFLVCLLSAEAARRKGTGSNSRATKSSAKATAELPHKDAVRPGLNSPVDPKDLVVFKGFTCPETWGRYPLKGQCDIYVECNEGIPEQKLCPDGMVFNPKISYYAYPCSYPIDVDCTGRELLQSPNATDDCPHQFGYFRVVDAASCGQFVNCADGVGYVQNCPEGLAYNSDIYKCDWPDQVPDCDVEAFLGFKCPPAPVVRNLDGEEIQGPIFRAFRSNSNCQRYILCLDSGPRLLGCGDFTAFDEETGSCVDMDLVDTCTPEQRQAKEEHDADVEAKLKSAKAAPKPKAVRTRGGKSNRETNTHRGNADRAKPARKRGRFANEQN